MYDLGRQVYVKSLDVVGTIDDRYYAGTPRRAQYMVRLKDHDFLTGSDNLRAADFMCDGCSEWWPGVPHAWERDGEYEHGLGFCFLCAGPPAERRAREAEERFYAGRSPGI